MAAGPAQGRRKAGRLGKRRRAICRTADVVPPRPGQVRRIPPPLHGRAGRARAAADRRTWSPPTRPKFDEYRRRYTAELAEPGPREALGRLRALAADGPVTLLTATKDLNLSQATVLA